MHILCLGINHHAAGLDQRAALRLDADALQARSSDVLHETAVLATCGRVELYAISPHPDFAPLEALLPQSPPPNAYRLLDGAAAAHLLRVAAGLDSMVLGEPQILGQVSQAYEDARSRGLTGPVLSRLFQSAIRAGKQARSQTRIGENPASVASVAVRLVEQAHPDLPSARILVLGAGEMAALALRALQKRGAQNLTLANRDPGRAADLAEQWGGASAGLEDLSVLLAGADVVIASTAAPEPLITADVAARAMSHRPDRPLLLMDIALPRDVHPGVDEIPNVRRFDLDDLHCRLERALARRKAEVPAVEAILADAQANFMAYFNSLDVVNLIGELRRRAETLREQELEKTRRKMPDLGPEAEAQLDRMTRALVKKILHQPTARLRALAAEDEKGETAELARSLFGLD